ncbi:MAG: hypothetical protein HOP11_02395 [Saprospiraceae bacterium]|nr:hypothetical protein [Saprospiraceae bacterium]
MKNFLLLLAFICMNHVSGQSTILVFKDKVNGQAITDLKLYVGNEWQGTTDIHGKVSLIIVANSRYEISKDDFPTMFFSVVNPNNFKMIEFIISDLSNSGNNNKIDVTVYRNSNYLSVWELDAPSNAPETQCPNYNTVNNCILKNPRVNTTLKLGSTLSTIYGVMKLYNTNDDFEIKVTLNDDSAPFTYVSKNKKRCFFWRKKS